MFEFVTLFREKLSSNHFKRRYRYDRYDENERERGGKERENRRRRNQR